MIYVTKSGSTYEVDGNRVRRLVRSDLSIAERVSAEWREAQDVSCEGVGHPLVIIWGYGKDEHSENAQQVGEGGVCVRTTITTTVVEMGS